MQRKISRPTMYIVLAAVAIGAYVLTSEETMGAGRKAKRAAKDSVRPLPEGFTKDDLAARFDRVNDPVRDAFVPVIVRSGGSDTASSPDAVPSALTGGDPNWVFTGMAEIDGVPMALIENRATGEGDFLKQSDSWKLATVEAISPMSLTLSGRDGRTYTLTISQADERHSLMAQGFSPVSPELRGTIGNGLEVTPERRPGGRSGGVASVPNSNVETRDGQN